MNVRGNISLALASVPERVKHFETGGGLSYRLFASPAESRRGHGQPADCLAATGRWPALRVRSLTTTPWKTLGVSHTSPQIRASDQRHHAAILFFGGLIQAGSGRLGGLGRPLGKRSGWAWNALSSTSWRAA